jgi:hypothetical protein
MAVAEAEAHAHEAEEAEAPAMKEAERVESSDSFEFLSVHLHTRHGFTDHKIFVTPADLPADVVTQLSYMIEPDIPELAKLLRGFDESAYRLELN